MQKRTGSLTAALGAVLLSVFLVQLHAQAAPGAGAAVIGPVKLTWKGGGSFVHNHLRLFGGVHMASTNYDLTAETVTGDVQPGKKGAGAFNIAKATAEGNAAKNIQVVGRFESEAEARTYILYGDHAVYTPDTSRKGGGKIEFTGNVSIIVRAPQALNGDAVTHVEYATVLLGQGPDYPQFNFSAGHLEATPLQ